MARGYAGADRWQQVKSGVKTRWNRLTDTDIEDIRGNAERLIEALQTRYGYGRHMALREITLWSRSLRARP
jgi:uncharacterized protein YjbJ (UPF0337 family)